MIFFAWMIQTRKRLLQIIEINLKEKILANIVSQNCARITTNHIPKQVIQVKNSHLIKKIDIIQHSLQSVVMFFFINNDLRPIVKSTKFFLLLQHFPIIEYFEI